MLKFDFHRLLPLMAVGVFLPWSALSGRSAEADQKPAKPYTIGVLPFASFSADKGLGGGIVLQWDDKRSPEYQPYYLSHRISVERTTRGISEYKYRLDSKYILPMDLRLTFETRFKISLFEPYHGPGGAQTRFDDTYIDKTTNNYRGRFYYMYDKRYLQLKIVVQGRLRREGLHWLAGIQLLSTQVDTIDYDDYDSDDSGGQTLLARHWEYHGVALDGGQENGLITGLVWDDRDHESTPRDGIWSELLLRWVPEALGSDFTYFTLTATHRQYVPLSPDLTLAFRMCGRYMTAGAPFFTKPLVDASFTADSGLGGDRTIRGVLWQRVVGRHFFLATGNCGILSGPCSGAAILPPIPFLIWAGPSMKARRPTWPTMVANPTAGTRDSEPVSGWPLMTHLSWPWTWAGPAIHKWMGRV